MDIKRYLEGHTGWMMGTGIAGLTSLLVGLSTKSSFLQVIGGALFGASLGAFISLLDAKKKWDLVVSYLHETLKSEFRGEEGKAEKYRKKWYLYYLNFARKSP